MKLIRIISKEYKEKEQAFEVIEKAFNAELIDSERFLQASEVLEKAKKDISKLIKKKIFTIRQGKPVMMTVYVSPQGEIVKEESEESWIETPDWTPEVMMGEYAKIVTKKGKKLQGVVHYIHAWKDKNGNPASEVQIIDYSSGTAVKTKINTNQIQFFKRYDPAGSLTDPKTNLDDYGYKVIKNLGGSTGAVLVEKDGKLFVRKTAANPEHLSSEILSLNIFKQMGVPVPKIERVEVDKNNMPKVAYIEHIEGKTLKEYESSNQGIKPVHEVYEEITKHFAAHAIMANHDVIGAAKDNIIIDKNGNPHFVDVGGSMLFRAQGAIKESWKNWKKDDPINEFSSMLDPSINYNSAQVFDSLKNDPAFASIMSNQIKGIKEKLESSNFGEIKLYQRLNTAEKLFKDPFEEKNPKEKDPVYKENVEKIRALYRNEITTALMYNRHDIAKFYEDFAREMALTSEEILKAEKESKTGLSEEFLEKSPPGTTAMHIHSLSQHSKQTIMNDLFRKLAGKSLNDHYNISFRDKETKVELNKENLEQLPPPLFKKMKFVVDYFAKLEGFKTDLKVKDKAIYRGMDLKSYTFETYKYDNIIIDPGISSNSIDINKSFQKNTKIVSTLVSGLDINLISEYKDEEDEVILKPFNMMQIIRIGAKDGEVTYDADKKYDKNHFQVRLETPGLFPIKL